MNDAAAGTQTSGSKRLAQCGECARVASQLQRANEELEALAHALSHDLRAPVRHIDSFIQLFEEQEAATLSPEGRRLLQRFRSGASRMGGLIDDLIDLSRTGRGGPRPSTVNTEATVRQVWAELVQQPGAIASLDLRPLPTTRADPALLRRLWHILLENALKFSGTRRPPHIIVDSWRNDMTTWYRITDNGVGFDDRYGHKLFAAFQRLHRAEEFLGNGIGLAIAKKIIDLHGGSIRARSASGQGAVFEFTVQECPR